MNIVFKRENAGIICTIDHVSLNIIKEVNPNIIEEEEGFPARACYHVLNPCSASSRFCCFIF